MPEGAGAAGDRGSHCQRGSAEGARERTPDLSPPAPGLLCCLGTQQKPGPRRARALSMLPLQVGAGHRAGETVRAGLKGHMEKATHVAPEAQPDLPACPLTLVFCPLPHCGSTTLTFAQFVKYSELIPATGPLHLLFLRPGTVSSSSFQALRSQHKYHLLLRTISLDHLCPHTLPTSVTLSCFICITENITI